MDLAALRIFMLICEPWIPAQIIKHSCQDVVCQGDQNAYVFKNAAG